MANDDEDRKVSWSSWFAPGDVRRSSNQENEAKRSIPVASPSQAQDVSKLESNPLITFKHFVDDTFSALTSFSRSLEDTQAVREDGEHESDKWYKRWTGAENTRHLIQLQGEWITATRAHCELLGEPSDEARATARMLLLESARRNSHVSPSKITALFEDPASTYGDEYPRWLSVEWFKFSTDSPVNLEADPALAKYDTKWRHAFEDLLEAALDKPMSSRERIGYRGSVGPSSTWRGPGLDWMLSLQCRGILPPQLPTMYENSSVASELFAEEGLSQTMLGRWCQQHSSTSISNLWDRIRMDYDYDQLLDAIETPAPEDTAFVHRKLEALGIPHRPGKCVNAIGANTDESLLRQHTTQHATADESALAGGCPDELGRAVSEATKQSHEPHAELDIYEQMYNDWVEDSEDQTNESESQSFAARCPDELGRAVSDAARQEAARAFADEENGLVDDEAGAVTKPNSGSHALQDSQMQLMLLDQQNQKRLAMARAEAVDTENDLIDREASMSRIAWRRAEQKQIQQETDASARCPDELGRAVGDAARQEAARAFTDEENGLIEEESSRLFMARQSSAPEGQNRLSKEPMVQIKQRLIEQRLQQLRQELDNIDWHEDPFNEAEKFLALNGSASSKSDWLKEVERMIEKRETLQRNQDFVNEFYIDSLAEQLQALRDDHEELADELADALARLEHKSRLLEQNERQSSLAHPQKPTSAQADTSRPQVLSTLTTTETTRLPDGSVKTTVVLKRRFADGLEERQESTQTSFEEPQPTASNSGGKEPSRKGWFWS
jgi:hypothetical protein